MAIERLTPQDGNWTGHSLHAHQHGCSQMCHTAAMHQYRPCDVLDPYDPCRTRSLQRPQERVSTLQDPLRETDRYAQRKQEQAKEEQARRATERKLNVAQQDMYESMYQKQSRVKDTEVTPMTRKEVSAQRKEIDYTAIDLKRETEQTARMMTAEAQRAAVAAESELRDSYRLASADIGLPTNSVYRDLKNSAEAFIKPQNTMLGGAVFGAANLVAAVATCNLAAFRSDMYEGEAKQVGKLMMEAEKEARTSAKIDTVVSFKDYAVSVVESKGFDRAARIEASEARDQKIASIESKRATIDAKYQSQTETIQRNSTQETSDYQRKVQEIDNKISRIQNSPLVQEYNRERQEKLQNAQLTYEHNKTTINDNRQAAISKIDRSTPIAAAQIREINQQYDNKIATLDTNHTKKVSKINAAYDDRIEKQHSQSGGKVAELMSQKMALTKQHEAAQAGFQSQLTGAKKERDSQIQTVRQEVAQVRKEYKDSKKEIKAEGKSRTAEMKSIMSGNYQSVKESKKNYAAAKSAVKHDSNGAAQLKGVLVANQNILSQFMINNRGTDQEKQLLASFLSDQHNAAECAKKGVPFTDSMRKLSAQDTQAALDLLKKHGASGLNSVEGNLRLSKSMKETMIPELVRITKDRQAALVQAQSTLVQLRAEKDALVAKNKQQGGQLSAADQQKLNKLKLDLSVAKNNIKAAENKVKEGQSMLLLAVAQRKKIIRHSELLAGLKQLKGKAPQVNNKLYKNATGKISNSLSTAIFKLNNFAQQGNAVINADQRFQRQVKDLAKHTNFAANSIIRVATIGTMATQMVFGLGKLGGKTLMKISSKSPIHGMVKNNLLVKFFGRHGSKIGGAIGKGMSFGGKVGTGLLKAPGKIISLASVSILDAPAMLEQKAAKLLVKGSVGLVKGSTRLAVKGAVRIGRKPLKYGVRAVKQLGKATNRGVRAGAKWTGKQIGKGAAWVARNTIGRTRLWQQAKRLGSGLMNGLQRAGGFLGRIGSALLKPFKAIGGVLAKFFSAIAAGISTIAGWVTTAISSAVSFVLGLAFGALFWLLIVILLLSVLDAIFEFFAQMTTGYKVLIQNDPSYVMNMGANYRNVELSILEFFSEEKGWSNNEDYNEKIECNNDPLYYAVFNNSFGWFGMLDSVNGKDINYIKKPGAATYSRHYNEDAFNAYKQHIQSLTTNAKVKKLEIPQKSFLETIYSIFAGLCNLVAEATTAITNAIGLAKEQGTFGDVWWAVLPKETINLSTLQTGRFRTLVATYDKVEGFFYEGTKASHTATPSTYEISNAKDVLAMMDAIYTMDSEMTRIKALRYMGVGEFQLTQHDDAIKNIRDANEMDNLFWKTHDIEYTDGVKAQDIVFHPQKSDALNQLTTISQAPGDDYYGILNRPCENFSTITYTYTLQEHVDGDPACGYWTNPSQTTLTKPDPGYWQDLDNHEDLYNYWTGCCEVPCYVSYRTGTTVYGGDGSSKYVITNSYAYCFDGCCYWPLDGYVPDTFTMKYYSSKIKYPSTPPKSWHTNTTCTHTTNKTEEFKFCLGHARLAADIYIATSDPPDGIPTIHDVAKTLSPSNYAVGNAIFTWSKDLNIRGWGPAPAESINPAEEWNDSGLVSLAIGKCEEPIEYYGDTTKTSGGITQIATKHGKFAKNGRQYLVVMDPADGLLHHVLYYQENIFYMSDFMPGEQKGIEVKQETRDPGSFSEPGVAGLSSKKISFKKSASGVYYMVVNGE